MTEVAERPVGSPVDAQDAKAPDWLTRANQAFKGSTSYLDTNYRTQWERNIRQFRSMHPIGSRYLSEAWKGKSKFFRPKTRAAVRKAEAAAAAAFFSTADVVDLSAIDDNDERQQASAALWKEVMQLRLTKSVPWFMTVMGAFQDTNVMGAVVSHQNWDFENDRPDPELRPLENIRIDPGAKWTDPINSSPYLIDIMAMYVHEVKEKAGWAKCEDGEYLTAKCDMDSTRLVREGNRTDPKEGADTGITDFDLVWVHRVIMRDKGEDVIYYTLGQHKLLIDPMPLRDAYPWLPKNRRIRPYVMGICVIETHRTMPSSPVELAAPVQSEINTLVNQRRDNVELVLNKRFIVARHKQVDIRSLTRGTAGSVTMANDPKNDIEKLEWSDVTSSAYQEEDRLNLDHDDLMGTFSGSSVASNRKLNETVGGMNLLSTEMNEMGDYTIKTFTETWLEKVLQQILWMEQLYEDDATILALAGQKAKLVQKFGIDTITDDLLMQELTLEINVGMGATNPLNSVERFMAGIQRLKDAFGPEFVAQELSFDAVSSELFGKLGYKDGKRFLNNTDDPQVQRLTQKVQALEQELANKRSPELDKANAQLKRAQAVKTVVEAVFGATQAAENIAAVPEIAPVADEVLKASGYTPPEQSADPNLPQPAVAVAPEPVQPNSSPLEPALPASPVAGVNTGIESDQ